MKKIIFFIVILAVVAGSYMYFQEKSPKPLATNDITWSFSTEEAEGMNPPQTEVTLKVPDESLVVGTFDGSCSLVAKEQFLTNQVSGVLCWFAGGGVELGVFNENGKTILKKGVVDEGGAEEEGFRGNFETIREL